MNPDVLQSIKHRGRSGDKGLKKTARSETFERVRMSARAIANGDANKRRIKFDQVRPRQSDLAEWEMLVQRTRTRTVIPFVGAGLSCSLLPMWERLIEQLLEKLGLPQMKGEKMPIKTEMIRDALRRREREKMDKRDAESSKGGLADEFVELFKKALEEKGCVDWFEPLVEADKPSPWMCPEVVRNATCGHRAISTGPWPLILTTNWDTMLEAAYRMMDLNHADIWDWSRPHTQYFMRSGPELSVRFRRNMQQVYAELRAGIRPPRLLKLHGDFTEGGKNELVAGHADYRQLMVRDVAFSRFMQHVCSHYNLLFYGCSLADPDMLATLDGMVESLGSEVGPHFWLTADDVSDERKRFLMKHYSVYTIRTEKAWQFSDGLSLLVQLCNVGWPIPKPLTFTALHYQIISQHGANINIQIEHRLPQEIASEAIRSNALFALAISAGISRHGKASAGGQLVSVIEDLKLLQHHETKAFRYNTDADDWRAKHCASNCWFVCAQDVGTSGSLRGVFEAVQHFVKNAVIFLVPGSSLLDNRQLKKEDAELSQRVDVNEEGESQLGESAVVPKETEIAGENLAVEDSVKQEGSGQPQMTDKEGEVKPATSVDSGLGETGTPSVQSLNSDATASNEGLVSRWFNAVYSFVVPEDSDSEVSDTEGSYTEEDEGDHVSSGNVSNEESIDNLKVTEGEDGSHGAEQPKMEEPASEKPEEEAPPEEEKPTLLQLAENESSEKEDSTSAGSSDSDDDVEHEDGSGHVQRRKRIQLILPLLSAGGGFLHGQEVLCATLSAIGNCASLVCGPDVVDITICLGTHKGADGERLGVMADIDVGRLCLGQLLTRAIHGKMEFTCVAPKDSGDYGSSMSSREGKQGTKWTCRKLHMPICATVNELRNEMGLPNQQGVQGTTSLLSANITDGSVVEIPE